MDKQEIISQVHFNNKVTVLGQGEWTRLEIKSRDILHWDDPNELVDRLRLPVTSTESGHNSLGNEILNIVENLQEAGYIREAGKSRFKSLLIRVLTGLDATSGKLRASEALRVRVSTLTLKEVLIYRVNSYVTWDLHTDAATKTYAGGKTSPFLGGRWGFSNNRLEGVGDSKSDLEVVNLRKLNKRCMTLKGNKWDAINVKIHDLGTPESN